MESRLQLARQSNGGVCRARNAGFAACDPASEFLLFLDADDCLEPDMLAVMTGYLRAHPKVGMVYCRHAYIDADDGPIPGLLSMTEKSPRYVPSPLGLRRLKPEEPETPFVSVYSLAGIVPSLAVIRRNVYQNTPGYDEAFGQHYEDTDLFLQIAIRSAIHYLPRPLVQYRKHGAQNTADATRFGNQEQKLYAKWAAMPNLNEEQQQAVAAAAHFRRSRLVPYLGLQAGTRHLLRGEFGPGLRFYGGALRRYFGIGVLNSA